MDANQRPPMVWVDGGTIYALVGADVQEFATGVENVQNLAVSGNKVYYTEKTGENAGTINAMNLDGTGAKQLVSIKAVPQGIAVDSVGKRLYWTNSHGWIQSSNLQGTARRNVAKGLSNPMGIAVAAGKTVYWTEDGPSSPELLNGHTGQSVPGVSVAISGNTLYWTAKTGENAGTIHSVNLNGTGAKHLVSIKAVPMGITVDSVGKRLYWDELPRVDTELQPPRHRTPKRREGIRESGRHRVKCQHQSTRHDTHDDIHTGFRWWLEV